MGMVVVKIKIMPVSPDVNLDEISEKITHLLEKEGGKGNKIEKEPIAFGLNALILMFGWDEAKEIDSIENALKEIEGVNSVEVVDMRRAIG